MSGINEFNAPVESNKGENQNSKPKNSGRSRKKFVIGGLLIVFIIMGAVSISFAKHQIDMYRSGGPFGFIIDRVSGKLDLNEQQKTEVNKIKDEIKAKLDANREKRKESANEFEQMFRSDNFDKQKALELASKRDADREEMKSFMIDEMAKFHSILTTEQRNKAADLMKEMHEKRGKFKDKHKDKFEKK